MLDTNTKNLSKNTQADLFLPFIFLSECMILAKHCMYIKTLFLDFFVPSSSFRMDFVFSVQSLHNVYCDTREHSKLSHVATAETFYMQSSLGFFLVLQLALSKRWCPGLLSFLFFIFSHWNLKIQRIGSSLSPPFVKVNIIMIRGD